MMAGDFAGIAGARKDKRENGAGAIPALRQPKVSVIVPNYNNELYLEKCLASLASQTLDAIEIIVVDDGSADASLNIVNACAARDPRIRLVALERNVGVHRARKAGVTVASGEYIMFLDSDDYYTSDACEKAYQAIAGKYDFVEFNRGVLTPPNGDHAGDHRLAAWLDQGKEDSFYGSGIIEAIYYNHSMTDIITNKIFAAPLLKSAFAEMKDIFMISGEDNYEGAVIFTKAKIAAKIANKISVYRRGTGTTSGRGAPGGKDLALLRLEAYKAIEEYLNSNAYNIPLPWIRRPFIRAAISAWVDGVFAKHGFLPFEKLAECFGVADVLAEAMALYENKWEIAARAYLRDRPLALAERKPVKRIGVILHNLKGGGSQHVALSEVIELYKRGYEITLFLCEPGEHEKDLPREIRRVYCGQMDYNPRDAASRLRALDRSLKREKPDLIIYHSSWDRAMLWHIILFHYYKIPVIAFNHSTFYNELLNEGSDYGLIPRREVLKCADGVLVLSRSDELYYRCAGVNARAIANPVETPPEPRRAPARGDTIIVVGRLGDLTKNIGDCLRALAEVARQIPCARMLFVGNFVDAGNLEKEFYALAAKLGVSERIEMAGWQENLAPFFARASIMLSTAWHESFCLSAVQAQGHGLPVVMYDLQITPAENNPAIIRVPIGDYKAAAREIAALLSDRAKMERLGERAGKEAGRFAPERHASELEEYMASFRRQSSLSRYAPEELDKTMGALAFYGSHVPPWFWKQ